MRQVLVVREVDARRRATWACDMIAAFHCHLGAIPP